MNATTARTLEQSQEINIMKTGDTVAYARKFLKTIADYSRDSAQRRAIVVAMPGETFAGYIHWRTRQPIPVREGFALVQWTDETYPRAVEPGDPDPPQHAHMVALSSIARVGSAAFAD